MKFMYVGLKALASVVGVAAVWGGHGDVQEVSAAEGARLLPHEGSFKLVDSGNAAAAMASPDPSAKTEDSTTQQNDTDTLAPLANLEGMDKAALRDFAQRNWNHEFHHATGEAKMRQVIVGLMNSNR